MRLLTFLSIILVLISFGCGESVEEIWINADGKGAVHRKIDMSEMISLLRLGMMMEEEGDATEMGAEGIEKLMSMEQFDTTMHIESIFQEMAEESGEDYSRIWAREKFLEEVSKEIDNPDSLWQVFEPFLDAKIQAKMDMPAEVFELTFMMPIADFNNIQKLNLDQLAADVGDQMGDNMPFDMSMFSPNIDYDFKVSKRMISIQIPHLDTMADSTDDDFMSSMFTDMMGAGSGKKLVIHVPGKVKKVNQSSATYNDNKVVYEVNYDQLIDKTQNIDLVIEFKPKRKYRFIAPN